jgi:hypothetical protein
VSAPTEKPNRSQTKQRDARVDAAWGSRYATAAGGDEFVDTGARFAIADQSACASGNASDRPALGAAAAAHCHTAGRAACARGAARRRRPSGSARLACATAFCDRSCAACVGTADARFARASAIGRAIFSGCTGCRVFD